MTTAITLLSVLSPAPQSCQLPDFFAKVELYNYDGRVDEAQLCFYVDDGRDCDTNGEIFGLAPGIHSIYATYGHSLSSTKVEFEVAGSCSPHPIDFDSRRVAAKAHRQRNGGVELKIEWPRPGEVARSSVVPFSAALVLPNRSMLPCYYCVRLQGLSNEWCGLDFLEVDLGRERTSPGYVYVDVFSGNLTAPPFELYHDPRPLPPPLPSGWFVPRSSDQDVLFQSRQRVCVVASHWNENLDWVRYQPYPVFLYEKDSSKVGDNHSTPRNTANEASAYLQFIVDYYDNFPPCSTFAFLHSHRYAYHQEDILTLLNDLHVDKNLGYCNLNSAVWGTREDPERTLLYTHHRDFATQHLGDLPPLLLDRCCAQFAVATDLILSRPKAFYEDALRLTLHPDLREGDREPNRQRGLLFEWLWHYIFRQPPVNAEFLSLVPNLHQTDIVYASQRPQCVARS